MVRTSVAQKLGHVSVPPSSGRKNNDGKRGRGSREVGNSTSCWKILSSKFILLSFSPSSRHPNNCCQVEWQHPWACTLLRFRLSPDTQRKGGKCKCLRQRSSELVCSCHTLSGALRPVQPGQVRFYLIGERKDRAPKKAQLKVAPLWCAQKNNRLIKSGKKLKRRGRGGSEKGTVPSKGH